MFNIDEEKIKFTLGNKDFVFFEKVKNVVLFISDVGIRGIYLALTFGTVEFKQLD